MDLSKLLTNKRVLKSLCNELRDKKSSKTTKTVDDLWNKLLLEHILGQFKFKLPVDNSIENTMDDLKAMLAEFDINGLRVHDKAMRYNGIWATNNRFMQLETSLINFNNFNVLAQYDPDGRTSSWTHLNIGFDMVQGYSNCYHEACDKMDLRRMVTMLINLDNAIDDFKENHWAEMKQAIQKQLKMTEMAENTIEILLKGKMEGNGIPYVIEKQKIRVKASFDIGKNQMVEMAISHKNFTQELDKIISTVKQLKDFIEQSDMQIRIKPIGSHGQYMHWLNTGTRQDSEN